MGKITRKAIAGLSIIALASCGKTEKVEGIKGPQGDKGEKGDRGEQGLPGEKGQPGPQYPYPTPTPNGNGNGNGTNLPPTNPYPPIIIVLPNQQCNTTICPQGTMLVCACIDGAWQTISVAPTDVQKLRIRNYGRCEDYAKQLNSNDCIWWPREQPQPQPIPTVTVTAYPIPYPTVTVTPRPQC